MLADVKRLMTCLRGRPGLTLKNRGKHENYVDDPTFFFTPPPQLGLPISTKSGVVFDVIVGWVGKKLSSITYYRIRSLTRQVDSSYREWPFCGWPKCPVVFYYVVLPMLFPLFRPN